MPNTHKNLFEDICSLKNLNKAYLKARRNKLYRDDVLDFSFNLEDNLLTIKKELETQTYQPGGYKQFYVNDPKRRLIKAAPFRDRVIHHAICNIIDPIFDDTFIYDSYACRKGKGTHVGVDRLQKFIRRDTACYALKCDITKYFHSITHETLFKIIARKIVDEKVLWLIKRIINSSADREKPKRAGIPIGNLTSQLFANIYLNELDYFVKHKLKVRHYLRYVDDFVILHHSKQKLHEIKTQIMEFLKLLDLELHPKKVSVFPIVLGIDFLGYRVFHSHRLLRKANTKKFLKKLKKLRRSYEQNLILTEKIYDSLHSWVAHAHHADTQGLRRKILGENQFIREVYDEARYFG